MLVTPDYYYSLGFDFDGEKSVLENALKKSQLLVDTLTDGKCTQAEIPDQTAISTETILNLKQAICAQAEYYTEFPLENSIKIGDFSVGGCEDIRDVCGLCRAILQLNQLCYCGCEAV